MRNQARTTVESAGRPKRVLILVQNLSVPFDRRVWQEARSLQRNGYRVSVICPRAEGESAREELEGVRIRRYSPLIEGNNGLGYALEYSIAMFWFFVLSLREAIRPGFDVIQACNPPDLLFLVAAFHKILFGKRFVFDHHDICPELYEAKFGRRGIGHKALLLLERATFKAADVSIATNESYRRTAIERGGVAPDQVVVVRSGPDLERMRRVQDDHTLRNGKKYLVGYVGVIGRQEGVEYLLDAALDIKERHGDDYCLFRLVGSGPDIGRLRKLSLEKGLEETVIFMGRCTDEVLLRVLSTSDVCVNPDEYNEMNDKSTMNKVMEYMALAQPVVQFDLTEGRVSAGDASLYADNNKAEDLADKINHLLERADLRKTMGESGQRRIMESLSWAHQEGELLRAYEALWGGARG